MARNGHKVALGEFALAWTFLTRFPWPFSKIPDGVALARCVWAFALVGVCIGAITGLALWLAGLIGLPPLVAGVGTVALTLLITGGLHEDGLADMTDGFGGGATRARKLEIMRDSRIGSYGAMALMLALIGRVAAYGAIGPHQLVKVLVVIVCAATWSRFWMALMLVALPCARALGLAAAAGRPSWPNAAFGLLWAIPAMFAATVFISPWSLLPIALSGLAAAALAWLSSRQIGGVTGDVCGATQVLTEFAMLASFSAMLH